MRDLREWVNRPIIRIGISFVWIMLVLAGYYWGHKPFDTAWVIKTGTFFAPLFCALLFLFAGGLLGFRILKGKQGASTPVAISLQFILGSGLLAVAILIVGLTLGINRWIAWGLLLLVLGLHYRLVPQWLQQWKHINLSGIRMARFDILLSVLLGISLLFSFLSNWLPLYHFDTLMYHVMLPKAYLLEGRITDLPWQIQSGMPQNGEMFYLWGISLLNEVSALLIVWFLGIIALMGLGAFITEHFGFRSALVGITSFLCGYTVLSALSWGYVDWVTFLFSTALLLAFFTWLIHQDWQWLVLAGIFGGLLMGSKYTSGAVQISMEIAITLFCLRTGKSWWKTMLLYNLPLLIVFSPWLIKNLVFTGNPVYPLFFVSGNMSPIRIENYQSAPTWGNWMDFIFLPVMATITGFPGTDGFGSAIGPLLLAFGVLVWVGWQQFQVQQRMLLKTVLWMAITGILVWATANQMSGFLVQTRMHYALFPLFIILSAAGYNGLQGLHTPQVRFSRIVQAVIIMVMSFTMIEFIQNAMNLQLFSVISGKISREEFLDQTLGWYGPAMRAIKELPEDTHTLLLYETRSYHCLPNCQPDEILDRWKRDWQKYGNYEEILQAWRNEGISHVMVYQLGVDYALEFWVMDENRDTLYALDEFITQLPEPIERFGTSYALYDIR
jgi:hypothetical protein